MAMMGKIRSMHFRQGKSISEIARLTSLSRNTIKKWLKAPQGAEPKYRRREMPTKLAPFVEALEKALKADEHRPRHERRTARALHVELQALGYDGGYTRLTDYIRARRDEQGKVSASSAFVPLSFELGDAFQFDWSEEGLVIGGIYRRVQLAHLKLCASRAFWLVAYPTQGHEMLFDAHTRSFEALGGIPRRGIYDNMKTAVDKVKKGKGRVVNARFAAMSAHYLFDPDFCNVASGWEKGRVEKNVQDSRRRVWIEAARQRFGSFDELNAWLAVRCRALWQEIRHPEHGQFSVAEMLEHELPQLMPMPRALRRLRGEPGARVQYLPGDSAAQPLLGAVRAGRSHGLHAAVPEPGGRGGRGQDRGQPRASERPRPDELRLAALHPAGAAQAWRAAQRRAVRRHARAAAVAATGLAAPPRW
ncbi:Transposase [Methylibium sp. T29]|nr:Transposase [Methylibium sp. T29]EWS57419.1 Transposase [Methylibium sp. T29-B]